MNIFKLVGSVFVDTDEANKSLAKTDEKAEGLGNTLKAAGKTVGKAAVAIGAAAVGAGTALVGMANNAAKAADEVDKGSIRMGVSTDYFQQLRYAAGQCGVEMSTMEAAAKKLEGTDLSMEDAIASIMSLSTEEERSAAAAELFGDKLAYQLSPILAGSGEDFNALMERANDLGLVMSEDSVAAGVKLGDTMSDVQQSFSAVTAEIGAEVMPIIQEVLDWVIEHMPEIKETITKVTDVLVDKVFPAIGEIIGWLKDKFEEYWPIISETVQTVVSQIQNIWETVLKPIVTEVWSFIQNMWNNSIKPIFDGVVEFFKGVFSGDVEGAFNGLMSIIEGIWNGLVEIIRKPVNVIIGVINGFISGITNGINSVIRALNGLQISVPKWVTDLTGVSSFGFSIPELTAPQIPLLAKGGEVQEEGAAIVGERGAELLQLPKGARVTPLEKTAPIINISIDVHPSEGMDERKLAELVAERINTEAERRTAAWA